MEASSFSPGVSVPTLQLLKAQQKLSVQVPSVTEWQCGSREANAGGVQQLNAAFLWWTFPLEVFGGGGWGRKDVCSRAFMVISSWHSKEPGWPGICLDACGILELSWGRHWPQLLHWPTEEGDREDDSSGRCLAVSLDSNLRDCGLDPKMMRD